MKRKHSFKRLRNDMYSLHRRRQNTISRLIWSLLYVGTANAWSTNNGRDSFISRSDHASFFASTDDVLNHQQEEEHPKYHTLPRLYVGDTVACRLAMGMNFTLSPEQAHYVTKVMRIGTKKSRDSVRVFDGINGEWSAKISIQQEDSRTRRRRDDERIITALCTRELRPQPSAEAQPWLLFAPIKKQRIKLMLEKCTELGVGRFVPILTERTEPSCVLDMTRNMDKLRAQTVEASEQCERLTVPSLSLCISDSAEDPWDLRTLLHEWSTADEFCDKHLLICRERSANGSVPVLKLLKDIPTVESLAFVVGPEGGWSPGEEALCDRYTFSSSNIHSVSLGSLVLRAETAAIAAVTACMLSQHVKTNINDRLDDS